MFLKKAAAVWLQPFLLLLLLQLILVIRENLLHLHKVD